MEKKGNDIILQSKNYQQYYKKITAKHHGDFYCLHCFYSFSTKSKLESNKKACENKDKARDNKALI